MSEYTFETAALKAVTIDAVKYNEEGLKNSMPIAWSAWTTPAEVTQESSIALGGRAWAKSPCTTALGANSGAYGGHSTSVGNSTVAQLGYTTAIGAYFYNGTSNVRTTSEAPQTVVIGNGAQILNPTNEDGSPVLDGNGKQIVSSNSVTIGTGAVCKNLDSVVIGANAKSENGADSVQSSVVVGTRARVLGGGGNVAIGTEAKSTALDTSIGYKAAATGGNSVGVGANSINNGAQKTTLLGVGTTITNTTAADGTFTKSENSTVIGFMASASAPNAVVLGSSTSVKGQNTIAIGNYLTAEGRYSVLLGDSASAVSYGTAVGHNTKAEGESSLALGRGAEAKKDKSVAIGFRALANDFGIVVFGSQSDTEGTFATRLYFAGAGTDLAKQYYNGEGLMGYTVIDKAGEVVACGTRRLSELFPDNSLTQPASLDENGEWVMPKVFHPSDLDLPIGEPTDPENVEINIPEPEPQEYIPLPVYPIVEPEIEEINE